MVPIYLAFILKTEKRNSQKNTTPIYIRLIRDRKKAEARLDIDYDLTDAQASKWNAIYQRLAEKNSSINNYLDELSARFSDYKRTFSFRDPDHSLQEILAKILAKEEKKRTPTVIPYLDKFYSEEIEFSNFKVKGTKINYKKAINHLQSFLCFQNLSDIEIVNFNTTLAEKFKNYLQTDYPEINKKINSPVSASSNIKRLKPIFDKAVRENLIEKNPFEKMKLVNDSPLASVLSIEQVKAISDVDLSDKPTLQFARDFFLLCCFSGLSYSDAISLSEDELIQMENGKIKINTERNKTAKPVKQVMLRHSYAILNKYKEFSSGKSLLPKRTGESINRSLKLIGAKAGIPFDISTKTARITCSQLINEAGIENQLLIDSFMGWSSSNKIRSRYFHIKDSSLLDFTSRFEKYLDEYLKQE